MPENRIETFQLKVDSDFHPASVAKVVTSDGIDITGQVKAALNGTTLTLNTVGIDSSITVEVNYKYVWPGDGGGSSGGTSQGGPADPASGPDWTFDSNPQGWWA